MRIALFLGAVVLIVGCSRVSRDVSEPAPTDTDGCNFPASSGVHQVGGKWQLCPVIHGDRYLSLTGVTEAHLMTIQDHGTKVMDITASGTIEINDEPKTAGNFYKRPDTIQLQHEGQPWATCHIEWATHKIFCYGARP